MRGMERNCKDWNRMNKVGRDACMEASDWEEKGYGKAESKGERKGKRDMVRQ